MKIDYYTENGRGVIIGGTPAGRKNGENMILAFDGCPPEASVFVNRKKYAVRDGIATVPAQNISAYNEIRLQYTDEKGAAVSIECEALTERDGITVGQYEHTFYFVDLKHKVAMLEKKVFELTSELKANKQKYNALAARLDGTDIFDLSERNED